MKVIHQLIRYFDNLNLLSESDLEILNKKGFWQICKDYDNYEDENIPDESNTLKEESDKDRLLEQQIRKKTRVEKVRQTTSGARKPNTHVLKADDICLQLKELIPLWENSRDALKNISETFHSGEDFKKLLESISIISTDKLASEILKCCKTNKRIYKELWDFICNDDYLKITSGYDGPAVKAYNNIISGTTFDSLGKEKWILKKKEISLLYLLIQAKVNLLKSIAFIVRSNSHSYFNNFKYNKNSTGYYASVIYELFRMYEFSKKHESAKPFYSELFFKKMNRAKVDKCHHHILTYSPDGIILGHGNEKGEILLWDADNLSLIKSTVVSENKMKCLEFTKDSKNIIYFSKESRTIKIENIQSGKIFYEILSESIIRYFVLSQKQNCVIYCNDTGVISFNISSGKQKIIFTSDNIYKIAVSCDERLLAIFDIDGFIIWDLISKKQINKINYDKYPNRIYRALSLLAFSPDNKYLLHGIAGNISVWNIENSCIETVLKCKNNYLFSLKYCPNGKLLVCGCLGHMEFWDATTLEYLDSVIPSAISWAPALSWHPSGKFIASDDYDNINTWQVGRIPMDTNDASMIKRIVGFEKLPDKDQHKSIFYAWLMSGREKIKLTEYIEFVKHKILNNFDK